MKPLTMALPKGRLFEPALKMCESLGFDLATARNGSRKLIVQDSARDMRFILLKPIDVLTFVEHGAADVGIVGQDILREYEGQVFEPLALPFGH